LAQALPGSAGSQCPGIFTAVLFPAVITWFSATFTDRWQNIVLVLFIYSVLLQHNSNAIVLLGFSMILIIYRLVRITPISASRSPSWPELDGPRLFPYKNVQHYHQHELKEYSGPCSKQVGYL
jgi:hypothetical protein